MPATARALTEPGGAGPPRRGVGPVVGVLLLIAAFAVGSAWCHRAEAAAGPPVLRPALAESVPLPNGLGWARAGTPTPELPQARASADSPDAESAEGDAGLVLAAGPALGVGGAGAAPHPHVGADLARGPPPVA